MLSYTEENYLKALLQIQLLQANKLGVGTNELATHLAVKPATANDMLKKLKEKKLVTYEKYGKITLTKPAKKLATDILRKHRLWETFLYKKLDFTWDEVHEVAEQLEHIQSQKLIDKLDKYLHYPEYDPHGDIIPTANGEFKTTYKRTLANVQTNESCKMVAVKDNTVSFLQYVVKMGLGINNYITVLGTNNYDGMVDISVNGKPNTVSQRFAQNIYVVCEKCELGKKCPKGQC